VAVPTPVPSPKDASATGPGARPLACIVMAGGKGTRMRSARTKVLHPVCGRPILGWVLEAARQAGAAPLVVVTPPEADEVRALLDAGTVAAVQPEARGTGHAVQCGLAALPAGFDGDVLVVSGDTPLIRGDVLREIVSTHRGTGAVATLLSVDVPGPNAYGRVVRGPDGVVDRVVEVRDATAEELSVTEINAGFYAFDAARLRIALDAVRPDNDQGSSTCRMRSRCCAPTGARGRASDGRRRQHRRGEHARRPGRGRAPPAAAAARGAHAGRRRHRRPGHDLRGPRRGARARLRHPPLQRAARHDPGRERCRGRSARRPPRRGRRRRASAGPFVYLRPGAELRAGAKAGTYVEVKNAVLGPGAKVPHLSYIGDADIGEGTNIGAGTITANYDGRRKHRTTIGARVRSSSDVVFVAPVVVGDDAVTAAGSVITKDVPSGALGIARARQTNIDGYGARTRDDA
jgi:bifunctional UDP-N-acetylglucosamine pyrophosphorylase/glucosamine-1-phosphate N-acetyltransferase